MNRSNVVRGDAPSDPPRRNTLATKAGRWTDKVFVIPSAVAGVIQKMNESFFGHVDQPPAEPKAQRRHRGFYVWNPELRADGKRYGHGQVVRLIEEIDPRTGEIKVPKH